MGRRRIICSWLSQLTEGRRDQRLLDIGCGTGTTLSRLRQFARGVGLDFSQLPLVRAKSRGLDDLVQGAAQAPPFVEGAFDVITMLDVLEHLDDETAALRDLRRALRPGGALLLTVPAYPSLWSQHDIALHHRRRYRSAQLRDVLERSGYRVHRLSHAICAVAPATFVFRWLQNWMTSPAAPTTALIQLPPLMNRFLISLLTVESFALRALSIPFGISLLCHAVKQP